MTEKCNNLFLSLLWCTIRKPLLYCSSSPNKYVLYFSVWWSCRLSSWEFYLLLPQIFWLASLWAYRYEIISLYSELFVFRKQLILWFVFMVKFKIQILLHLINIPSLSLTRVNSQQFLARWYTSVGYLLWFPYENRIKIRKSSCTSLYCAVRMYQMWPPSGPTAHHGNLSH